VNENPKVPRQAKRCRRGVTLIEAVLYIAISLALIIGGLVFFQQASEASRVNAAARILSVLVVEGRLIARDSGQSILSDVQMERVLIAQGSVPAGLIDMTRPEGHRIRTPWGSRFFIGLNDSGASALLLAFVEGLPVAACARLTPTDFSGKNIFTTNIEVVWINDDEGGPYGMVPRGSSPAQAATTCKGRDLDGDGLVTAQFVLRVSD
jgi:hypothetical protein